MALRINRTVIIEHVIIGHARRAAVSGSVSSGKSGLTNLVRLLAVAFVWSVSAPALASADMAAAGRVFRSRCSGCHTFGQGVKVGPDLKGVTDRRQRHWLVDFVRSSSQLIRRGDPIAVSLFRNFNRDRT